MGGDRRLEATLLVLAGGQSRRMGRPKAELEFGGGTLLERTINRLGPVFAEVLVSVGDAPIRVPADIATVTDLRPGAGPLAGIEAGLAAAGYQSIFAVACDMPLVTPELATEIVSALNSHDAAVPRIGGRAEPACAAYARSAGPAIAGALSRGERRASAVLQELDVAWLDGFDAGFFRNLNTPDDYRRLLDAAR